VALVGRLAVEPAGLGQVLLAPKRCKAGPGHLGVLDGLAWLARLLPELARERSGRDGDVASSLPALPALRDRQPSPGVGDES
jgi:hypothetical protein